MGKLRFKEAVLVLRDYGMVIRKTEGEYRINFRFGLEAAAYYTNDLSDTIQTARSMHAKNR